MPRVPRKVGWFHYEDQGSGEPLVFLHPFGGSTRVWNDQATYFLDKGYRVIRVDMRSHGLSTGNPRNKEGGEYSIPQFAIDLENILDHAQVESAHVVGASMGAMIAVEYATRNPHIVQKLCLVGGFYGTLEHNRARFEADHAVIRTPEWGIQALIGGKIKSYFGKEYRDMDEREREAAIHYFRTYQTLGVEGYIATDLAILQKKDQHEDLQHFAATHPREVLLITGEHDFFRDAQDALMAGIEDLRLHVLPDAGHLCWLNKPKEFNDAVYNFLR